MSLEKRYENKFDQALLVVSTLPPSAHYQPSQYGFLNTKFKVKKCGQIINLQLQS
jgi:hypothetical protein